MEIGIRTISNSRTKEGGWQDEEKRCRLCGNIASAYACLSLYADGGRHTSEIYHIRICKSCLEERIKFIDKAILEQTKTRV